MASRVASRLKLVWNCWLSGSLGLGGSVSFLGSTPSLSTQMIRYCLGSMVDPDGKLQLLGVKGSWDSHSPSRLMMSSELLNSSIKSSKWQAGLSALQANDVSLGSSRMELL